MLAHSLLNSLQQARLLVRQQQQRKESARAPEFDPLLKKAQNWACDIMDISHSDLDELMSTADEGDMVSISLRTVGRSRKWYIVIPPLEDALSQTAN